MDLNEISCFVKVVQERSITKAAIALGVPKSTVSRKVSALEERLGVTLLNRTTRSLSLTEAGGLYFDDAERAMAMLAQAEEGVLAAREEVAGLVRVTAAPEFGVGRFMEVMQELQDEYPQLAVELVLTERYVDLVAEGFDLALRIGELKDSSLRSRRIGQITGHLVASARYLKEHGTPRSIEELEEHALIEFSPNGYRLGWTLRKGNARKTVRMSERSRLSTNAMLALKTAAVGGQGIALLPSFVVEDDVAAGRLKVVLPEWRGFGAPVHLVWPGQRFMARSVRSVVEGLAHGLRF